MSKYKTHYVLRTLLVAVAVSMLEVCVCNINGTTSRRKAQFNEVDYVDVTPSLTTPFTGTVVGYGNTFAFQALRNIGIIGLSVRAVSNVMFSVQVYTREGYVTDYNVNDLSSAWTLVLDKSNIRSRKNNNRPTPLPDFNELLKVPAFTTRSFYVMSTSAVLLSTSGQTEGTVFAHNSNMRIYSGGLSFRPAAAAVKGYAWNGEVRYSTITAIAPPTQTPSARVNPTIRPNKSKQSLIPSEEVTWNESEEFTSNESEEFTSNESEELSEEGS